MLEPRSTILSLRHISKSFSGIQVLNDIDVDFLAGEVHCILGENGAGKSTLIKIISGAYSADSGEIEYLGEKILNHSPQWARDRGINTIYQEIDTVDNLSAAENVFLGNEILSKSGNINRNEMNRRAKEILNGIGVDFDVTCPVHALKLAQRQMVAIAKALSLNTKLIIFDEPTAVFTSTEVKILFNTIRTLREQGKAILYISHHLEEIFEIGDKITILRDGNHVKTGMAAEFTKETLVNLMVGRNIDLSKRNFAASAGHEVLRVEKLNRPGAVCDVSFALCEGEILGVAGLVGAGRSEMARLIVGLDPCASGKIFYKGAEVRIKSPQAAIRMGVAMLPEDRKNQGLVLVRSVGENIAYGKIGKESRTFVNWSKVKDSKKQLIKQVGVRPPNENMQVTYLSGGNQQKVVLGRLLGAACDLLILDEPTRGVDVGAREEIYALIQQLKREKKAILMISSDLTEILSQSDRILVMAKGKLMSELSAAEATEAKILASALQVGRNSL